MPGESSIDNILQRLASQRRGFTTTNQFGNYLWLKATIKPVGAGQQTQVRHIRAYHPPDASTCSGLPILERSLTGEAGQTRTDEIDPDKLNPWAQRLSQPLKLIVHSVGSQLFAWV